MADSLKTQDTSFNLISLFCNNSSSWLRLWIRYIQLLPAPTAVDKKLWKSLKVILSIYIAAQVAAPFWSLDLAIAVFFAASEAKIAPVQSKI